MTDQTTKKAHKPLTGTLTVATLALLACLLWGSAVPGVRFGYKLFGISKTDPGSQILFGGIRFFLAGLSVVLYYAIKNRDYKITQPEFRMSYRLACFQTIGQYFFYYMGLAYATGVSGSIMIGFGVFIAVIMSCVIFKLEPFTSNKIVGCLLGFFGILVASGMMGSTWGFSLQGEGLILISTVSSAYASIQTREFSQKMNPVKLSGWQFMLGGIVLTIVGYAMGGQFEISTLPQLGILLWLIMVSSVAFALWTMLLRDNNVSLVSMYRFMIPIFGVILSLAILGTEGTNFGLHTIVGLAFICGGIIVVQKPRSKTSQTTEE